MTAEAQSRLEHRQAWMRERHAQPQPVDGVPTATAFERHFRPNELAKLWGFNPTTVRRMFEDEPGVLEVGKSQRRDGKRDYVSLRIPESVALKVYQKHCRRR